ncbi:alpha/beta fold hydrolase [Bradyrhizobium sp. CCBAU 45389]|uniref:alpha/beta fold hydrolase n=1 Tax=Bradyrhizobium sp. CCBAU 45389 TaxID=858429 RepID=UPI002304F11B|nr:alpha/beta hydrolase [Bradyrhizobium sp. CCBAU 45389]
MEHLASLENAAGAEVWHFASSDESVSGSLRETFQLAPIGALNVVMTPYCGGQRWRWILPRGGSVVYNNPATFDFPVTRTFRTTLTLDIAPPDDIAQEGVLHFLSTLFDLKTEVDERADDLFEYRGLRCLIAPTARVNVLRTEQAAAIIMAIADRTEGGNYVVAGAESLSAEDFLERVGNIYGVSLLPLDGKALFSQRLTAIDALFDRRLMNFAEHLGQPDCEAIEHAYNAAGMRSVQPGLDPAEFDDLVELAHQAQLSEHSAFVSHASKLPDIRTTHRGDRELSYSSTGSDGEAVVLLNALGQGPKPWSRLIAHLRPRFRVLSWDPRGLDESESQLSLLDHVADLASIIERESVTRVHLVGWCTGPKIAAEFALRHPDRLLSMTFLNMQVKCLESSLDFDTPYETDFQALFSELEQSPSTASSIAASLTSRASEAGLDLMIETETEESEAVLRAMNRDLRMPVLRPFRDANTTIRFAHQMIDFWHYDVSQVAGQIDVPILLFASEYDRIAAPKASEWARGLFPRARLLQAPGATHYFLYDRADVVARMIEWFASGDGVPERSDGQMLSLDPTYVSNPADTAGLIRAGE